LSNDIDVSNAPGQEEDDPVWGEAFGALDLLFGSDDDEMEI
jgi:hypothetical protein